MPGHSPTGYMLLPPVETSVDCAAILFSIILGFYLEPVIIIFKQFPDIFNLHVGSSVDNRESSFFYYKMSACVCHSVCVCLSNSDYHSIASLIKSHHDKRGKLSFSE